MKIKLYKNIAIHIEDAGTDIIKIFLSSSELERVQISAQNYREIVKNCTIIKGIIQDDLYNNEGVFYNPSFISHKRKLQEENYSAFYRNLKVGQRVQIRIDGDEEDGIFVGIIHTMPYCSIDDENINRGSSKNYLFKTARRYIIAPSRFPKKPKELMSSIKILNSFSSNVDYRIEEISKELNKNCPKDFIAVQPNSFLFSHTSFYSYDVDSSLIETGIALQNFTGDDPLIMYNGIYYTVYRTSVDECILNVLYADQEPIKISFDSIKDYEVHVFSYFIKRGYFKNESYY